MQAVSKVAPISIKGQTDSPSENRKVRFIQEEELKDESNLNRLVMPDASKTPMNKSKR